MVARRLQHPGPGPAHQHHGQHVLWAPRRRDRIIWISISLWEAFNLLSASTVISLCTPIMCLQHRNIINNWRENIFLISSQNYDPLMHLKLNLNPKLSQHKSNNEHVNDRGESLFVSWRKGDVTRAVKDHFRKDLDQRSRSIEWSRSSPPKRLFRIYWFIDQITLKGLLI